MIQKSELLIRGVSTNVCQTAKGFHLKQFLNPGYTKANFVRMCSKIILVLALSIIPFEPIDGKPGATIEFLYASSLFRSNHLLANVTQLLELHDVPRAYNCLAHCLARKHNCKAFNYGANGTCTLLAESLCNNEAYELTPNEDFNYYDVLPTFDHEVRPICHIV